MANICLTFGTRQAPAKILKALQTTQGLANWWTSDTSGDTHEGGTLAFRFGGMGPDMKVLETSSNKVVWRCVAGGDEWVGTTISFEISEDEMQSHLTFQHAGWASETPFFHHCSMKWATFLLSLKQFLETGTGSPYPNDIHINAS